MKNLNRPRISFLNKKTKRKQSLISNNSNDSSAIIDINKYNSNLNKSKVNVNTNPLLAGEIINIYDNPTSKEKIILLKNNLDFCFIGKGTFRILYGQVKIFGYDISSDNDVNDFNFDINENYGLYTCTNQGDIIQKLSDYEKIIKSLESFTNVKNNKNIKDVLKLNIDNISICYFKNVSDNFKILTKRELLNENYEYIDFSKYEEKLNINKKSDLNIRDSDSDYDHVSEDILSRNNKFIICGKKNSGKSTFLHFLINTLLSKIKNKVKTKCSIHPYLFFIDCDSGQPLLSSPYNVSFIKINKPLFNNYYKKGNISSINEESQFDIIRSLFVEETSPANNFEDYLNSVQSLSQIFNQIQNKDEHYLIVNTNGYTSGLGNVINSSIIDMIKADLTFYVKNKKSGRIEKGGEFENYILKEEEQNNMNIILRKYKVDSKKNLLHSHSNKKITNLEIKSFLIENDFELKEEINMKNKNRNKNIYIYSNLIGEQFSLNNNNYLKSVQGKNCKENFTLNNIIENYLNIVEIPMDDLIFSFNFNEFTPVNELDVFFAINAKMCFVLNINDFKEGSHLTNLGNTQVLDFLKLENKNKTFFSFAFIYNIDIIKRKLFVISDKLNNFYSKENASLVNAYDKNNKKSNKFVLYRNNSTLDKNIQIAKEANTFENMLINNKFSDKINFFNVDEKKNEKQIEESKKTNLQYFDIKSKSLNHYITRNKYSII